MDALTGSFLQVTGPPLVKTGWAFRHPTLWEGLTVPTQSHLLIVMLADLTGTALLTRVDCGDKYSRWRLRSGQAGHGNG